MNAELYKQSFNFLDTGANRSTAINFVFIAYRERGKNSLINSPIDVLCPRFGVFPFFSSNWVVFGRIVATFQLQPTYLSDFKRVFFFVFDFFNWWLSLFHSVRANDRTWNCTEKKYNKVVSIVHSMDRRIFGFELIFR